MSPIPSMSAPYPNQTPTNSPAGTITPFYQGHRTTHSVGSTAVTQPQMYGTKLHPVLRDRPTGRHILSGKHREAAYKQDVARLEATSTLARDVQNRLVAMLAWADVFETLNEGERWELASMHISFPLSKQAEHARDWMLMLKVANIQFLINKEVGDTPSSRLIYLALVHEGDRWYRVDVKVQDRTVLQGREEVKEKRAMRGLKRRVDELVYGERREYMG